jgi:hypothetical protein
VILETKEYRVFKVFRVSKVYRAILGSRVILETKDHRVKLG